MAIEVVRTFHPVGQGAFYSEEFIEDGETIYLAVYDCGTDDSLPDPKNPSRTTTLKDYVDHWLMEGKKKRRVDVLFISHFHKDHISAVKALNPKEIYMPFLSSSQLLELCLGDSNFDAEALKEFDAKFGNKIIRVLPPKGANDKPKEDITPMNNDSSAASVPSGTVIQVKNKHNRELWEYVMYNPKWNDYKPIFERVLKVAIAQNKIDKKELDKDLNGKYVLSKLSILKKIYGYVSKNKKSSMINFTKRALSPKDLNEHSLQVYSGARGSIKTELYCFNNLTGVAQGGGRYRCIANSNVDWSDMGSEITSGCLYMGDITVEKDQWWQDYATAVLKSRWAEISTIQFPHHGAYNNGKELLEIIKVGFPSTANPYDGEKELVCVISSGTSNTHNHPAGHLFLDLLFKQNRIVALVTEDPTTLFEERFRIESI